MTDNHSGPVALDPRGLEALARAYDREDAALHSAPDPWEVEVWDAEHKDNYPDWYAERIDCARRGLEAYLAATPAAVRDDPVAVKALEWDPFRAETPFGYYHIDDQSDRSAAEMQGRQPFLLRFDFSRHPSLESARAAAQADYEKRVRSCLTRPASSAPGVGELAHINETREGKPHVSDSDFGNPLVRSGGLGWRGLDMAPDTTGIDRGGSSIHSSLAQSERSALTSLSSPPAPSGVVEALREIVSLEEKGASAHGKWGDAYRTARDALAALQGQAGWRSTDCATDNCGKTASTHFVRGDIGSYYCHDCYLRIQALPASPKQETK